MSSQLNQQIRGLFPDKPITYDLFTCQQSSPKKLVIFSHGFKGFKDWGTWDLVAEQFIQYELDFLKFNFSHNGVSAQSNQTQEITDLIAFSNNNFSLQLDDLSRIIDYQKSHYDRIFLIGHSMGGGISLLTTSNNKKVDGLVTWASVTGFNKYFINEDLKKWEQEGVLHVENSRTKQMLPIKYQLYQDIMLHQRQLDIFEVAKEITVPVMLLHGSDDQVVPVADAKSLVAKYPHFKLKIIEEGSHTFSAKHPWEETTLPQHLKSVVEESIEFFKKI